MSKLKAKQPDETKRGKAKGLIYGAPGAGKTWFTLNGFPSPYYIDTEGGARLPHYQQRLKEAGGVYLGQEDGSLDFDVLAEQVKLLATEKHNHKTLIVDSITKIFKNETAKESVRLGDKDVFGASKKPAMQGLRALVMWIQRLDMNVWFVAHETSEWGINPKTGQREEVGIVPDVAKELVYDLDFTGRVVKTPAGRVMITRKSRLLGFPEGEAFPLEYAEFATRYGKDFIEAPTKTITLIDTDRLNTITKLLSVVKVEPTDLEKYFTKCGVDKLEDLTAEQGDKLIEGLKKRMA